MDKLERYLVDKNYISFVYCCKTSKYKKTEQYQLSSMTNLDHRYIPINDLDINGEDIKIKTFDNMIIYGLHEYKKPPTLIYPRPNINIIFDDEKNLMEVKLRVKTSEIYSSEIYVRYSSDDYINILLQLSNYDDLMESIKNDNLIWDIYKNKDKNE